jgi:hypothetical protein
MNYLNDMMFAIQLEDLALIEMTAIYLFTVFITTCISFQDLQI